MPNEIKAKLSTAAAFDITLTSLASSSTGVGRQAAMVDNSQGWQLIHVYARIQTGTSPTDDRVIKLHAIQGDQHASDPIRMDGAGSADAAITISNALLIAAVATDDTSNDEYFMYGTIPNPGPEFTVAVSHNTGVSLNASANAHAINWVGENPEVQ